jgi:3D (Asp-Asp-Asp) domain-containing protein
MRPKYWTKKRLLVMLFAYILVVLMISCCEDANADNGTIRVVTAYNAGDVTQCDDTPCISANNENICEALDKGLNRCAANFVPLGTTLHIDKVGYCLVTDRTNRRYKNRVDIAMKKTEKTKALRFGRQKLYVRIIK